MTPVELNEAFLAKIAGWEAMKQARAWLAANRVLSSHWSPPVLKGVVQDGSASYRSGLVIKDALDLENLCSCRASQQWGTICAHSVAVGLHYLTGGTADEASMRAKQVPPKSVPASAPETVKPSRGRCLRRTTQTTSGEWARIGVIFPPHLAEAVKRGQVMLYLEAARTQGRQPLDRLPESILFQVSAQDADLLDWLEAHAGGATPAMLSVGLDELCDLLGRLTGHPRVSLGRSQALEISAEPWRVSVRAGLEAKGEITLRLEAPSATLLIRGSGEAESTSGPEAAPGRPDKIRSSAWILHQGVLHPCLVPADYAGLWNGPLQLSRSQVPVLLGRDWDQLPEWCDWEANFAPTDFQLASPPPRFHLHLAGGLAQLQAVLQGAYGTRILTLGVTSKDQDAWMPDPACPTRYAARQLPAEQAALARLIRCGFSAPDAQGRLCLNGQEQVLRFFASEYPRLQREWTVTLEERLQHSTVKNFERIEPRCEIIPSGVQWFDLEVAYTTDSGQKLSPAEIQRLVLSGQSYRRLDNGRWALLDAPALEEFQEVLRDCNPEQRDQRYRLRQSQAGYLLASLQQQSGWQVNSPADWREKLAPPSGETALPIPALDSLDAVLRPYQRAGVSWLWFLRQNGFGGILADEMGLGKTLQTLALLRGVKKEQPGRPSLIICPTSLVWNWQTEIRRFTPDLRALLLTGPDRQAAFPLIPEHEVVITSFALIRRDAAWYRDFVFDTLVLDEAQHIKNRQTQNAQAVKSIQARHRLVLTGTPLENSVADLWSIFDFLMPGYLGAASDFRERYELPIARDRDAAVQSRLSRRLRPFLLRRLKKEVARELPEKLEHVAYCELTEDQAAIYRDLLAASRREVIEAAGQPGPGKSRLVIFNALLRLRQVCCDPRLLRLDQELPASASGKLELFGELIEEVLDGGHRVLVFSQFVSMLALLREYLDGQKIAYCYLDGSTANRAEPVAKFQHESGIPIFLISLKAGGLGLNLTGADTVIHYDPWWNPAVEDQATDRAHRIGQTRVVTSYKLITRGTIEEKIQQLQQRKRDLIKGTLGGHLDLSQVLSWDELQDLLA